MVARRQADRVLSPAATEPKVSAHSGNATSRVDYDDPYWEYDENDCGNCGGEGFVFGCSWDWQCGTYDEGEGTCLCTRRCDWCNPAPRSAEADALAKALSDALDAKKDKAA